jgi:(S)-2-hydroxyglutarate dehydrogenase
MDQAYDMVVIGGGIVGLATAMQCTQEFPQLKLLLVEKESGVARHQSGHNSGVIHSGIYYKPGSLKAKLCVEGAAAMVEFCREHGIAHEVCGKVIVAANEEELPRLQMLFERGQANGLSGLRILSSSEIREIEPHCHGLQGIHVPSTGITNYAKVCEKYAELTAAKSGTVRTSTEVTRISHRNGESVVETSQGAFTAKYIINCTGLHSDRISRLAGEKPQVQIVPFRGEYYDLVPEKEYLVKSLIYPVPDPRFPFLGVHFTRRIAGGVDAGPNAVLALKREGYSWTAFSARDIAGMLSYPGFWRMAGKYWRSGMGELYRSWSKSAFVTAMQQLIPEIQNSDVVRDGSGVRAQALRRDGFLVDDFQFLPSMNMLHVCNVPSPAATASLSISREIVQMAEKEFSLSRTKSGNPSR